jgi:TRAP-type C4-dicarboxylate transport system permease small subunit
MNETGKKPEGIIGRLQARGGFLGELGLVFMVASITYDVILRYVFVAPTHWALEVNTFLLAFLCVIPAGEVLRAGSQIRITFLLDRLSPALKGRLDILRGAVGLFFCGIMIWKGGDMALTAWQHNDRMSTSLGTPMVIPYIFIPIGFLLLAIQYAVIIFSRGPRAPGSPGGKAPSPQATEVEQQI